MCIGHEKIFQFCQRYWNKVSLFIVFMFSSPCIVEIGYLPFSLELPCLSDTSSMWPHPVLPPDPAAFWFFSSPTVKGCFCCYVTGAFPTFINSSEPFHAVPLCRGRAEAGVAVGWGGLSAGECTWVIVHAVLLSSNHIHFLLCSDVISYIYL